VVEELISQHDINKSAISLDFRSQEERQIELSRLVKQIKRYKNQQTGLTKKINQLQGSKCGHSRNFSQLMVMMAAGILPFFSQGDQIINLNNQKYARVTVRSTFWAQVGVVGKESKYSPCEITVAANEQVTLGWRTQTKSGFTALTLKPGEHIVLDDSFFRDGKTSTVKGRYDRRAQKHTE
jgi:hypothetical protein